MMTPNLNLTEGKILKAFIDTQAGTNKKISAITGYTENTVRNYMVSLRAKFHVENRTQLFMKVQIGK